MDLEKGHLESPDFVKATYQGEDNFYICSEDWTATLSSKACEHMGRGYTNWKYFILNFIFIYFIYLLSTSVKGSFDLLHDQVNLRKHKSTNSSESNNDSKNLKLSPSSSKIKINYIRL